MGNVSIANQTMKITAERKYELSGRVIELPDADYKAVEVFSPRAGEELLAWDISERFRAQMCSFRVVNEDSFQAARSSGSPSVFS